MELALELLPDVPAFIRGDPTRLSQVVTNLVSNAVKFTADGEVVVRCAVEAQRGDEVSLRFEVRDTGIGIAPEHVPALFEAFSQAETSTTRNFGGTGLGLAISRQLVAAIGGRLGVESQPGSGSTFWFTGTFETGDPMLVARTAGATQHVLEGRRMLVVDDSATNRRILTETLVQWGVEVESAAEAEEAVERVRRAAARGEAFDVVLLDLVMPGPNGLELARMITRVTEAPRPVLLLLSSAQGVEKRSLTEAGITLSLTKPVGHSALFDGLVEGMVGAHGLDRVTEPSRPRPTRRRGRRVLVVEDNEINRMVAQGVLDALGYESDVAVDGGVAVEMAAHGGYDAILMDVQMPKVDGYEATRMIRTQETGAARVPIIAMTAGAVEGESERCLAAGMDAYLTKPLDASRLGETLESHLLGRARAVVDETVPDGVVLDPARLAALRDMGGDTSALIVGIVTSFVDGVDACLSELRAAAHDGDAAELARLAHKLRGSAANLGAVRVSQVCLELEGCGLSGETVGLESVLARLRHAVDLTLGELRHAGQVEPTRSLVQTRP